MKPSVKSLSPLMRATISGTGMCVPDRVVTNLELAERMNTTDEWIRQRTGIVERRHVVDGETPGGLGTKAALNAMARAKCRVDDIDLLLVATLSPEHYFPGTASFIQRSLGMGTKPSMDIRAQCSGFIYGLSVANSLIVSGQYKRILLVAVEVQSRGLDFSDRGRDMAALFGDGAGAVVVEASKSPEHGFMNIVLKSEGEHAERLWVEYPSMASTPHCPASAIEEGRIYPKMDGKFVFKSAVARLPEVIQESLEPLHLSPRDIDTFVFHQANLRINEFVANSFGLPAQKFPYNIDRYGNCSSASIPILLDECVRNGAMSRGNLVCFAAFGSGFTWGSAVMRWS